jgi:hypothetical protein
VNLRLITPHFLYLFPRIQLVGTAEVAAHHIKASWNIYSHQYPDTVLLKVDLKNDFNNASRAAMMRRLLQHPVTQSLW